MAKTIKSFTLFFFVFNSLKKIQMIVNLYMNIYSHMLQCLVFELWWAWVTYMYVKSVRVDYSLGHILSFSYTERHFPHVRHFLVGSTGFLDNYALM